jgi:hypothetical protein
MWKEGKHAARLPPLNPKPRLHFEDEQDYRRSWCSLVAHYSMCHLTRPSDKMIALASLAESLRNHTGDTYLAGLWEKDLVDQLCWRFNPRTAARGTRTRNRYAPSWSWASLDGGGVSMDQAYYYSKNSGRVRLAEVLGVSIESDDPAGLHSFTTVELRMRAIAVRARITGVCDDKWAEMSREEDETIQELMGQGKYMVSVQYPGEPGAQSPSSVPDKEGFMVLPHEDGFGFRWDEYLHSGDRLEADERSRRLLKQQGPDLQLVFIARTTSWNRDHAEGLMLSRAQDHTRGEAFVRVGWFRCRGETLKRAYDRLSLALDPDSEIDLADPRLAGLVQTITVV